MVAIIFGALILIWPGLTLAALVFLIGAFATVDGVCSLIVAFLPMSAGDRLWTILTGIAGIAVGVITFVSPGISALALLYLVGLWAIVVGAIQFVAAFTAPLDTANRLVLLLYGLLCVVFGVIMFMRPGAGALGLVALIAVYAIFTGIMLIAAAYQFRAATKEVEAGIGGTTARSHA